MKDKDLFNYLLGKRLRRGRVEKGLSQETLADEVGIDYKHLGRIENGKKHPLTYTSFKLQRSLDIDVNALYDEIAEEMKIRSGKKEE